ncbi:MAG: (d)CMP kinase [Opitutales bacterium]
MSQNTIDPMNDHSGFRIISIDGGAASGKSSTAREIAKRLNLMHVDTGAHYRTLTHALLLKGLDPEDDNVLRARLQDLRFDTQIEERSAMLCINGKPPENADIRSPEVNRTVSRFAANQAVRESLFNYQRKQAEVAREHGFRGLVVEGRDIGSVIFPDADFRFFLFADEATRRARRLQEGQTDSIAERDESDSGRKHAPLVCPEGAIRIDTAPLPLQEVVDKICAIVKDETETSGSSES